MKGTCMDGASAKADIGPTPGARGSLTGQNAADSLVILHAEDDAAQARLIEKNLRRAEVHDPILHFHDGQEILDFLLGRSGGSKPERDTRYVLLLDIRMPKVDGVQVLEQIKASLNLRVMPIIIFTTTDDRGEVDRCHALGCSHYIVKPVDYDQFAMAIQTLGRFLSIIKVPCIGMDGIGTTDKVRD